MSRSNPQLSVALAGLLLAAAILSPVTAAARGASSALVLAAAESAVSRNLPEAPRLAPVDRYRLALLRLKGHLTVARTLLQLRADGADWHLRQPVQAIFLEIEPQLAQRGAPLSADTLEQLERATEAAPQAALATIDLAAAAIDGSFAQTGAVRTESALALTESLLLAAVHLYDASVADHEVVDLATWRTGRGLVLQAEALARHAGGLRGRSGHDELVAAVILIRQAWPGVNPPPIVFGPDSVAGRLEQAFAAAEALR